MIVDLAENKRGERRAIFGQGDTPACEFYLLRGENGSPWIKIDPAGPPPLPIRKIMEWKGLRRFPDYR